MLAKITSIETGGVEDLEKKRERLKERVEERLEEVERRLRALERQYVRVVTPKTMLEWVRLHREITSLKLTIMIPCRRPRPRARHRVGLRR